MDRETSSLYVCVFGYNEVLQCNAVLCGCTSKSIFSGFISTTQFVEKQHKLTLRALILWLIVISTEIALINISLHTNYLHLDFIQESQNKNEMAFTCMQQNNDFRFVIAWWWRLLVTEVKSYMIKPCVIYNIMESWWLESSLLMLEFLQHHSPWLN